MTSIDFSNADGTEPKFRIGRLFVTKAAKNALAVTDLCLAVLRHCRGDWGDVSESDRQENEFSLKHGYRLLSLYHAKNGTEFWIITEANRRRTTVLLPDDY